MIKTLLIKIVYRIVFPKCVVLNTEYLELFNTF